MSVEPHILFELAGWTYGLRSADVERIDMLEHVTPVPNTAPAVDGVVFSRGQVIPAINLRVRFGLPRQANTPQSRLVFVRVQTRLVALIVDSAREFRNIPAEAIRPVRETLLGLEGNYVRGVATLQGRPVLILDVGVVLTLEEIIVPAAAPAAPLPGPSLR